MDWTPDPSTLRMKSSIGNSSLPPSRRGVEEPPELNPDQLGHLKIAFELFDLDHDGFLNHPQLSNLLTVNFLNYIILEDKFLFCL